MQPITSQTLETERLILRAWRADDLEDFYAYASEPGGRGTRGLEASRITGGVPKNFRVVHPRAGGVCRCSPLGATGDRFAWRASLVGGGAARVCRAARLSAAREGDRVCTLQRLLGPRLDAGGRACGYRVRVRYAGTGGADRRAFSRKCAVEARD